MMLHRVSSISTTIESSSLRLPPDEVTARVVAVLGLECQSADSPRATDGSRTNSVEILRLNNRPKPFSYSGPRWARILVTGPGSANSAQATSGCWQHHFCCLSPFVGSAVVVGSSDQSFKPA